MVVGRAAILLECAHLVHNCNKGQWPYWVKSHVVKNTGAVTLYTLYLCQIFPQDCVFVSDYETLSVIYELLTLKPEA